MSRPPQLLPNGFLTQKSVFKKHLMERIINLFEYTSNLIRGASPSGSQHNWAPTWPRGIVSGVEQPSLQKEGGVCDPSPPPRLLSPLYVQPKSHRKKKK